MFLTLLSSTCTFANGSKLRKTFTLEYNSEEEEELLTSKDLGESNLLQYFIHTSKVLKENEKKMELLEDNLNEWRKLRFQISDAALLKDIFYTTHRKFLKNYKLYSSFSSIFENGQYDCLTATSLYAYILNELRFDFEIVETRYHMALLINDGENKYLIESTDPIDGLITDAKAVQEMLDKFEKEEVRDESYKFKFSINRKISIEELPGLLYYNQAVRKFNEGEIFTSFNDLQKALIFHRSPRIQELMGVVLEAAKYSKSLSEEQWEAMLDAYLSSISLAIR